MSNATSLDVRIKCRRDEAEDIISLELRPVSGENLPAFEAGSHIDVNVGNGIVRQYSLCNDPRETHRYVIGVLREPRSRGGSESIHSTFHNGRSVAIERPRNNFRLNETAVHSILIGGGIGITPMIAMAWRLHSLGASFELHYCSRSRSRTAFSENLGAAPFADKVFFHLDDGVEAQKLDVDNTLGNPAPNSHLYLCGPSGFLDYFTCCATRLGWTDGQIHTEYFSSKADTSGDVFTVRAARSGLSMKVHEGETIAGVLQAAGIEIPLSCEQGVCGTCLTRVIEGVPDHRDVYLTEDEKVLNNQLALCCSRSKTAILVLDI